MLGTRLRGRAAALGTAALLGAAGLVVAAPAASAADGSITQELECQLGFGLPNAIGPQTFGLSLTDPVEPGGTVTLGVAPSAGPASSPISIPDVSALPTLHLQLGGAVSGTADVTASAPNVINIVANQPISTGPWSGPLTIPASATPGGTVNVKVTGATTQSTSAVIGTTTTFCGATSTAPTGSFSFTVAAPVLTPTARATPAHGLAGAVTTVGGANFPAGAALGIQGLNGSTPTADSATTTSAADGTYSGTITVNDPATTGIVVHQVSDPSVVAGPATYTVDAPAGDLTVGQEVDATVKAGTLAITKQGDDPVTLTPVTLNGRVQTATGNLNVSKVTDFRGGTSGWSLTAKAVPFTSADGGTIPAANLSLTPSCTTATAGPSACVAGTAGSLGDPAALLVARQNAGTSGAVTGGEFTVGGTLSLSVPAYQLAGEYASTVTLTLA